MILDKNQIAKNISYFDDSILCIQQIHLFSYSKYLSRDTFTFNRSEIKDGHFRVSL